MVTNSLLFSLAILIRWLTEMKHLYFISFFKFINIIYLREEAEGERGRKISDERE